MAGMSCGAKCLKIILFVFNILIWIAGGVMLGFSIWLAVDPNAKAMFGIASGNDDELWNIAVYMMIGVGAAIFLIAFLGCCGAWRDSRCMLLTYSILLVILLALEITCGTLAVVYNTEVKAVMHGTMMKQVTEQYTDNDLTDTLHTSWDNLHQSYSCCGVDGPKDWQNSTFHRLSPLEPVPNTCCNSPQDPLSITVCFTEYGFFIAGDDYQYSQLHTEGCYNSLLDWFIDNSAIIIGIAFGVAAVQLFAIIFACCLYCNIGDMNEVV